MGYSDLNLVAEKIPNIGYGGGVFPTDIQHGSWIPITHRGDGPYDDLVVVTPVRDHVGADMVWTRDWKHHGCGK